MSLNTMREINTLLTKAARVYESGEPEIMSNYEYDKLYKELEELEESTGVILSGSITQKIGIVVADEIYTKKHKYPIRSLKNTKSVDEMKDFLGNRKGVLSWKLDGLTIVLTYKNGEFIEALTRGNGVEGEDVTNNVRMFTNVPLQIAHKGVLVVRGEALIRYSTFKRINKEIERVGGELYRNPRNLCAGTVRQHNSGVTKERDVELHSFEVVFVEGVDLEFSKTSEFDFLESQGFNTADYYVVDKDNIEGVVEEYINKVISYDIPTDGLVLTYEDTMYGESLGATSKTPRHSLAYKWEDEVHETTLRDIIWQVGRTGVITPVAIFDTIEIDGTEVSKASLHNISIIEKLQLGIGDRIGVIKACMIIPQIVKNLDSSNTYELPEECPICGGETEIVREKNSDKLQCTNDYCEKKFLRKLMHFVGRDAMNIKGLAGATLEKMVDVGVVSCFSDLFKLEERTEELFEMEAFGWKSYENLIESIDRARYVDMPNFIFALGIPKIGLETAKLICEVYDYHLEDMASAEEWELDDIEGIGEVLAESFSEYFMDDDNVEEIINLIQEVTFYTSKEGEQQTFLDVDLRFEYEELNDREQILEGMTFVCTGALNRFENRPAMKALIEELGGKLTGSVTSKTDCLITNDTETGTVKNNEARRLGVEIITEIDFIERFDLGQYLS